MKPMTVEEVSEARRSILKNAADLLNDAEILLNAGKSPRAFSLAVIACEELAKLPMLARAGVCVKLNLPFDWKRFDTRLRHHVSKLGMLDMFDFMLGEESDLLLDQSVTDAEVVEVVLKRGLRSREMKELNLQKQDGLYVNLGSGELMTPQTAISADRATKLVLTAKAAYKFFQQMEDATIAIEDALEGDTALVKDLKAILTGTSKPNANETG